MSYRLLSYLSGREARAGLLVGDGVYDLATLTRSAAWSSVLAVLEDWPSAKTRLAQAAKALASGRRRAKGTPLKRVKLLAPETSIAPAPTTPTTPPKWRAHEASNPGRR